jgi:hypothetical protein
MDQVGQGDVSKLEVIDQEFEKLVKDGEDTEVENGIRLMKDFLFNKGKRTC